MAAQVLEMPFSTVQQYYRKGPRRIPERMVKAVDSIVGQGLAAVGQWLADIGDYEDETGLVDIMPFFAAVRVPGKNDRRLYQIPGPVLWRVYRILDEIGRISGADLDGRWNAMFATVIRGIEIGLFEDPTGRGWVGGSRISLEHTKQVHRLCDYWEHEFGIGRPTADTVSPVFHVPEDPQ